ncbi:MAG TPA: glycosyltransferase [bacterium]|nr:glycosyltransferase [bacterium]
MRILIVAHDHPFVRGSGVGAYCGDLERELSARGHDVFHLFSSERSWGMRPHLRWSVDQRITFASLVNSPLPPALAAERPLSDCIHPEAERLFEACVSRIAPDLVHIHAFQGLSGSVLILAKRRGLPVIVTLHDFWGICARVILLRANGEPCSGPDGGRNCARFCSDPGPLGRRLYRRLVALAPPGRGLDLVVRARSRLARMMPGDHAPRTVPEAQSVVNGLGALTDMRAHGARATFLREIIREADAVLAVSNFVKETFVHNGMPAERIQVLPLGLRLSASIEGRVRRARDPLRIAFLGRVVPLKGAFVLAQAVREIPPERARVLFFGPASADTITNLQATAARPLEFRGPYRGEDLPAVLDEADVVVVPTLFQETVGLAALEAQAAGLPVIASRTGAVPEYIEDGRNGFLFDSGNPQALRASLQRFLDAPELVAEMSGRARRPMTIGRHVDLLAEIYHRYLPSQPRSTVDATPFL